MRFLIAATLIASATQTSAMTHKTCLQTLVSAYDVKTSSYELATQNWRNFDSDKVMGDARQAAREEVKQAVAALRDTGAALHRDYINALADYCETLR